MTRQNEGMSPRSRRPAPPADLADPALYINRELSWLEFNHRVLALAADADMPLLERCKFMAIFSSNLDEFFMVRVAGHQDALEQGRESSSPDQMTRDEILEAISTRTTELLEEQGRLWNEEIVPALAHEGMAILSLDDLDSRALRRVKTIFSQQIFPVLTPLAVGPGQPFPYISGLSLNLAATVTDPGTGEARLARIKVFPGLPRFHAVPGGFVPTEEIVRAHVDRVFPGMDVTTSALFRVTRDADFDVGIDVTDLMDAVEAQLRHRRFGDVVRLEVERGAGKAIISELRDEMGVESRDVYRVSGLLDMTSLWELMDPKRSRLMLRAWTPRVHPRFHAEDGEPDIFAAMRQSDILVHHPYDDFESSVGAFIDQASADPEVVAIKQTIYRTSGDTPIIPALIKAAGAGKQTVCLVELQARFDEERNIGWARALERAGVHVVYGQVGMKTHAKIALVVRREDEKLRRYAHIGTGNYHPATARLYTDVGLFTARPDITEDIADLFNYLTGFGRVPKYRKLLVAPEHMRAGIIAQIDRVIAAHRSGVPASITMKMNAIIDAEIIQALYRASQAGVPIDLFVRGICGLRPGLPGLSETIRVSSIVGRFLEHTRILAFRVGDETEYWIGSADMMVRNLDNRVEAFVPVEDPAAREELATILDMCRRDTALSWTLSADGAWRRVEDNGAPALNAHDALMTRAIEASRIG